MVRKDIQALRAFAVLIVIFFHADIFYFKHGYIGVDVFFVISGFLILGKISKELVAGNFQLLNFWARRITRLLPASAVTILLTLLGAKFLLPQSDFAVVAKDAIFGSLNIINWQYAQENTDYWDVSTVSPFLHFWSLSVEEQFYLVSPIFLILTSYLMTHKITTARFRWVLILLSLLSFLALASFKGNPSDLYFNSFLRIWEFAIGGVAALTTLRLRRIPRNLIKFISVVGLLGFTHLPMDITYPGIATLGPVVLTAMFLVVGDYQEPKRWLIAFLNRIAVEIGNQSYSLYLWHWPITVFYFSYFQGIAFNPEVAPGHAKLGALLLSLVAGWFSYKYIETPTRGIRFARHNLLKLLTVSTVSVGLVFGTQSGLQALQLPTALRTPVELITDSANFENIPAEIPALEKFMDSLAANNFMTPSNLKDVEPKLDDLLKNTTIIYETNCHLQLEEFSYQKECAFGDVSSDVTVMLIGDSHAASWFPALAKAAETTGVKLYSRTKSSCGYLHLHATEKAAISDSCEKWREALAVEIVEKQPDLIVMSQLLQQIHWEYSNQSYRAEYGNAVYNLIERELLELSKIANQVWFVHDIPKLGFEPSRCLAVFDPADCVSSRMPNELYFDPNEIEDIPRTKFVNLNDFICADESCQAANAEYIIFRDKHHLSAPFSETLAPLWSELFSSDLLPAL